MHIQHYRRVKSIAETVLDLAGAAREQALRGACEGDAALRTEVEAMLAAIEAADASTFLETPAAPGEATIAGTGERRYRIVRELGHGGMGTVYLAERADGEYRQQVALKTLNVDAGTSPMLAERLRSERQILAQLQHPNIARLLDGGTDAGGRPFLAMEYVDGERIDRWCERHAPDVPARIALLLQICDAVQYAHQHLVVHRDIKPGNILVDADGVPKLLDFGIARLIDGNEATGTATTDRLLTFRYASPEQIRGERVGTASDLYSLAVVLYRLLTGHFPYASVDASAPELARAVLDDTPRTPSRSVTRLSLPPEGVREIDTQALARQLSGDLDAILLHALRKTPGERYASVAQFADDLRRHLDGLPVLARQGQRGYALRKFVTRHRWGVLGAAAALALLVGFTAVIALQLDRTRIERDRANAVAEFFSQMFEESNPLASGFGSSEQRANITVREVLDREAPRIEEELADQPEVQATLLASIGRVYVGLDLRDAAEHYLGLALQRHDTIDPAPDRTKLALAMDLCDVLGIRGRDATLAACDRALALARALGQDDGDADLARALRGRGAALKTVGRWDDAEADLQQALAILQRLGLPAAVAGVQDHLAEIAYLRGDRARCLELLEPALAAWRKHYGNEHAQLSAMLTTRAHCSIGLAKLDQAEADLREALDLVERAMGADAQIGVRSQLLTDLGLVFNQQDRFAEAEPLLREALRINENLYGKQHPELGTTMSNFATTLMGLGRHEEAFDTWHRAIEIQQRRQGDDRRLLGVTQGVFGYQLWTVGRLDESERMLREALATFGAIDPAHPDRAAPLVNLGTLLTDTQRAEEALPLLREGVALRAARLPPGNWRLEAARSSLGACLHALGQDEEAGPMLESSHAALREQFGDAHQRTRDALERLRAFEADMAASR